MIRFNNFKTDSESETTNPRRRESERVFGGDERHEQTRESQGTEDCGPYQLIHTGI